MVPCLTEQFVQMPFYPNLEVRGPTFSKMIEHLENHPELPSMIETGTARIQGNWGGDGQSTLIWDWVAEKLSIKVTSIDIDAKGVETARSQTKYVSYEIGDSLDILGNWPKEDLARLGLLYLDSYDWNPELQLESSFHHLSELALVYSHLPSGCMIAIDDCHGPFVGKHTLVLKFMTKLGIAPAFRGYQIGWIKP